MAVLTSGPQAQHREVLKTSCLQNEFQQHSLRSEWPEPRRNCSAKLTTLFPEKSEVGLKKESAIINVTLQTEKGFSGYLLV